MHKVYGLSIPETLEEVCDPRRAALLFHFSLLYLALLFAAMALDATL